MSAISNKKRRAEDDESLALVPAKRPKTTNDPSDGSLIKLPQNRDAQRLSDLEAPSLLLSGHQSDVLSTQFSHGGENLLSTSRDKQILLWRVFGDCKSYLLLKGHKNAVVQALWSQDDAKVVSGSSDKTLGVWDSWSGKRLLKLAEHESFVNAVSIGKQDQHMIASVGDDSVCYTWDDRSKKSSHMIQQRFPLVSVALLDERNLIFTGGIDNVINAWDVRKPVQSVWSLKGHSDTVTSLRVDPDSSFLLSVSLDSTIRIWDVRPFAPEQRCTKVLRGFSNGIDRSILRANWSSDGAFIGCGSSDRNAYIFDTLSGSTKHILPGHTGTVTEVDFHPKQPIIASSATDKNIFLGEVKLD